MEKAYFETLTQETKYTKISPLKLFSKEDVNFLIEFLFGVEDCRSLNDLNTLILSLRLVVKFKWCYFCLSRLGDENQFLPDSLTMAGVWNNDWFDHYIHNRYYLNDPVITHTYRNGGFGTLIWDELNKIDPIAKEIYKRAAEFEIVLNGLSIGYKDKIYNSFGGIFCVIDSEKDQRTIALIEFVTPHINRSVLRLRNRMKEKILTDQERTILIMFGNGINRKQISEEFGISLRRIGQVLEKISIKLDTHNTVHALSEAIIEGILYLQ